MTNKHPKTDRPSDKDLVEDPGIGTSKGRTRSRGTLDEVGVLDGDNTFPGDVRNDTTPGGGVDPKQTGRTNK